MSIRETEEGVVIDVWVQPGAKRSRVVGTHGDAIKIAIAAPPVDGKANSELLSFLAKTLGIRHTQVELMRGEASRNKSVRVVGVSEANVRALLNATFD